IVFVAQRAEIQIVQLHLELLDLLSELLIFRLCEVNRMAGRTVKRFAVFAKLRPALLRQPQAAAAGMRALNKFELNGRHNYFLFLQLRLSRPVRLPTQRRMSRSTPAASERSSCPVCLRFFFDARFFISSSPGFFARCFR